MLNEFCKGTIKSVKAEKKAVKSKDGVKHTTPLTIIKLESSDIDYNQVERFNPSISTTLLNIQPMPFVSVNFGYQTAFNFGLRLRGYEENQLDNMPRFESYEFLDVLITNLTVKVKANIPVYHFTLEIPDSINNNHLYSMLKECIEFEFYKI